MARSILVLLTSLILIYSCNNEKKDSIPTTSLEAGRAFIRASLDGDFSRAENLILKDTQNIQIFERFKSFYAKLPVENKKGYKEAGYTINKYDDINDSTTIINYSNDYMNKPMEIKVVRENKEWKIDFKYTYSGNLPID